MTNQIATRLLHELEELSLIKILLFFFAASSATFGQEFQYVSKYPEIPIVDVHYHVRDISSAANLIRVSEIVKQKYGSNIAFWIGFNDVGDNPLKIKAAVDNRILFAVATPEGEFELRPRPHYLRYLLSTYPNLYIDISSIDYLMHYPCRDNLRGFFIEYQDRILFGLDAGTIRDIDVAPHAESYAKFFAILETDQIIDLGYSRNMPTKGLELPVEVLEKLYYKNALKLYPGLREALIELKLI